MTRITDRGAAPTEEPRLTAPNDGVWEALQRLIENAATLGPASQEDAMIVARWRGQFVAEREGKRPTAAASEQKIALLIDALESIQRYGLDTLSGRVDGPDDRQWQRAGVNEMTKRARIALESYRAVSTAPSPSQPTADSGEAKEQK